MNLLMYNNLTVVVAVQPAIELTSLRVDKSVTDLFCSSSGACLRLYMCPRAGGKNTMDACAEMALIQKLPAVRSYRLLAI
jgi:hypothetical protein